MEATGSVASSQRVVLVVLTEQVELVVLEVQVEQVVLVELMKLAGYPIRQPASYPFEIAGDYHEVIGTCRNYQELKGISTNYSELL